MISIYFRGCGHNIDYQADDVAVAFCRWFPRNHHLIESAINVMFDCLTKGKTTSGVPLLKELANRGFDLPTNDFGPIIVRLALHLHPELRVVADIKPTGWGKLRQQYDNEPTFL